MNRKEWQDREDIPQPTFFCFIWKMNSRARRTRRTRAH